MLAIVLGYASQVGTHQILNGVRWHTYSLLARALLGFDARRVIGRDMTQAYEALVDSLPVFRDPVRRWFERRSEGPSIGDREPGDSWSSRFPKAWPRFAPAGHRKLRFAGRRRVSA